ncbi:MAG: SDR family oxidoreductase [Peptococcaceae bacterium]|nr:SDR family oxidoreductase [Peptococcaceae bacterium]
MLIVGGTSRVARFLAYRFAGEGAALYLAGRDRDELDRLAGDIAVRFAGPVHVGPFDLTRFDHHAAFLDRVLETMGWLDGVVLLAGCLGDQEKAAISPDAARYVIDVNYTGPVCLLTLLAAYFARRGSGFIVGVSSVAGDRGRRSNYVYGSAKGGLSLYLQGLRNRLHSSGVKVITVKPGFLDTGMTFGIRTLPFLLSPEKAAGGIHRSITTKRDVLYLPPVWLPVMLVIKAIPETIFKKLNL